LQVLALLPFPSSNWSSSAGPEVVATEDYPGCRARMMYMPRDLDEFATYIRRTVQHYKNRLGAWEVLNEPIYTSYALSEQEGYRVEDYLKLLQVAYQQIKATDPSALVIGGIADGSIYTEDFIRSGGLAWVDALNLHIMPRWESPDVYEERLRELREQMYSTGLNKPIYFTEGAYYGDDDMPFEPYRSTWLSPLDSEIEAAERQAKFNILLLTYGAELVTYHSGSCGSLNNEDIAGVFFEWAAAPRKMLVTQSAMANLLSPPITSLGPIRSPKELKAYGFESNGRTVIVAWTQEDAGRWEISLTGKLWRAVDLQGNELELDRILLTDRPVYFIVKGTMPEELPW
jgi:hypothetical protein